MYQKSHFRSLLIDFVVQSLQRNLKHVFPLMACCSNLQLWNPLGRNAEKSILGSEKYFEMNFWA